MAVSSYETWTVGNLQKADALLVLLPSCKIFDLKDRGVTWWPLMARNDICDNVSFELKK